MYTLKVTCSCGAVLELEFDRHISITASGAYDRFLKAHENCIDCKCDKGDPLAADPDTLNRLDEMNPNI